MTSKTVMNCTLIMGILALMTLDLFLDYCLEENRIKATTAAEREGNSASTMPEPSLPPPPVRIVSQNAWADDSNQFTGRTFHIVGEVINESSDILDMVKVVATLYDANNQVVGTDSIFGNQ